MAGSHLFKRRRILGVLTREKMDEPDDPDCCCNVSPALKRRPAHENWERLAVVVGFGRSRGSQWLDAVHDA